MKTERDLLFISYATEDVAFSDWLALKLTSLGYRVWYDRMSLLAGHSWVKDVDVAIENQTFRQLALLSRHSVTKPNPSGERTKAQAVGKKLGIEGFVITLNVDGLPSSKITWTLIDKSYVSFHENWAEGLKQLLKTLDAIGAPRDVTIGQSLVKQWQGARDRATVRTERVWTNTFPILQVPAVLRQYELRDPPELRTLEERWAFARREEGTVWAFHEPPAELGLHATQLKAVCWADFSGREGEWYYNASRFLIRRTLEVYARRKGLQFSQDQKAFYFPKGLLPSDKFTFLGLMGKLTWLKVVGERNFRVGAERVEKNFHHLGGRFKLVTGEDDRLYFQFVDRVFITNEDGSPLHPSRMNRRRKKICKNWWNDKFGSRLFAMMSFLSAGQPTIDISTSGENALVLAATPLSLTATVGIDEEGHANETSEWDSAPAPLIDDLESIDPIKDYGNSELEETLHGI